MKKLIIILLFIILIPIVIAQNDNIIITPDHYKNSTHANETLTFNTFIVNKDDVNHTLLYVCRPVSTNNDYDENPINPCDSVSFFQNPIEVPPTTLYVINKVNILVPNSSLYGYIEKFDIVVVDITSNETVHTISTELIITPDLTGSPLRLFIGLSYLDFTIYNSDARPVPLPNVLLPLILIVGMLWLAHRTHMKKRWWLLLLPLILFGSGLMIIVLQRLLPFVR